MDDKDLQQQKERFQILLKQLEMTDDQIYPYFQNGAILKLTVHKKSKLWDFSFRLENILPFRILQLFDRRLNKTFSHLANVTFHITTVKQEYDEQLVQDYWEFCLQEMEGFLRRYYPC